MLRCSSCLKEENEYYICNNCLNEYLTSEAETKRQYYNIKSLIYKEIEEKICKIDKQTKVILERKNNVDKLKEILIKKQKSLNDQRKLVQDIKNKIYISKQKVSHLSNLIKQHSGKKDIKVKFTDVIDNLDLKSKVLDSNLFNNEKNDNYEMDEKQQSKKPKPIIKEKNHKEYFNESALEYMYLKNNTFYTVSRLFSTVLSLEDQFNKSKLLINKLLHQYLSILIKLKKKNISKSFSINEERPSIMSTGNEMTYNQVTTTNIYDNNYFDDMIDELVVGEFSFNIDNLKNEIYYTVPNFDSINKANNNDEFEFLNYNNSDNNRSTTIGHLNIPKSNSNLVFTSNYFDRPIINTKLKERINSSLLNLYSYIHKCMVLLEYYKVVLRFQTKYLVNSNDMSITIIEKANSTNIKHSLNEKKYHDNNFIKKFYIIDRDLLGSYSYNNKHSYDFLVNYNHSLFYGFSTDKNIKVDDYEKLSVFNGLILLNMAIKELFDFIVISNQLCWTHHLFKNNFLDVNLLLVLCRNDFEERFNKIEVNDSFISSDYLDYKLKLAEEGFSDNELECLYSYLREKELLESNTLEPSFVPSTINKNVSTIEQTNKNSISELNFTDEKSHINKNLENYNTYDVIRKMNVEVTGAYQVNKDKEVCVIFSSFEKIENYFYYA